jgi:hypothetical protein
MSNNKYPALSFISTVFKIFGWVNVLIAAVCVLYALFQGASIVFFVGIGTLFSALLCFAFAEAIIVLVDIEYNTRMKVNIKEEMLISNVNEPLEDETISPSQVINQKDEGLDLNHPRVQDVNKAAMDDISKLRRNGYQLISTKITPTTECWVLMSQLDSTKFEMNSLKELSEFASNFK